jgi:hypothetical protein
MNPSFTFNKNTRWIRDARLDRHGYNQTVIATRTFTADACRKAVIRITADSCYRLFINGQWIQDGPSRAYPEHYLYDEIDVTEFLQNGENELKIIARYYGVGLMKDLCTEAGLLAQLDLEIDGGCVTIGTDCTWLTSPAVAWKSRTPKIGCQMEPFESYDAQLENGLKFQPAHEAYPAHAAPWKDLSAAQTLPLTRSPRKAWLIQARIVERQPPHWSVPVTRLCHPGVIEMNRKTGRPLALAAILPLEQEAAFDFSSDGWRVFIDGTERDGTTALKAGTHELLFFVRNFFGHHDKDLPFPFRNLPANKWQALVFPEPNFAGNEMVWDWFRDPAAEEAERHWSEKQAVLASTPFAELTEKYALPVTEDELFYEDPDAALKNRRPLRTLETGLTHLHPNPEGELELCFDFGAETVGYFFFELEAPAGTVIDLNAVEYIRKDGAVQHTVTNRNGLRYSTKEGANRFTSLKRRGGRYLFVTLRNQSGPVNIREIGIIESTAPVEPRQPQNSGDEELDQIRQLCERTLQLCMEDTFTDCPLYEQVCWIGDARNEALYAYRAFGDTRVARRSLELGAQSLERYPLVGAQIPSAWDCILPAWSFLWGIAVKEYFEFTCDLEFLKEFMPAVRKNMDGARSYIDPETGLFRAKFWNLLDWADIDHEHEIVMHNSMLLVGALQAAEACADALDENVDEFKSSRLKLTEAINRWWSAAKQAYPDSLHADGAPSPKTCQHTCALALMFDVAP